MKKSDFDFENYKVIFCPNKACKYFSEEEIFPNFNGCFEYHNPSDRRRKVLISNQSFNYSPKYYFDSNENSSLFCQNPFEYFYHPLNYKTKKCEKAFCVENYCPFFHKNEEKEEFELYRKKFQDIKFQGLFDPVLSLCMQINNSLKIDDENIIIIDPLLKQPPKTPILITNPTPPLVPTMPLESRRSESISSSYSFTREKPKNSYFMNQEVNIYEDHFNEFKQYCKKIDPNIITKYICAFLNVRGGTLFLGINDQGLVKGIHMVRKKRDEFILEIDQLLKKFTPPLLPDECFMTFCPVYTDFKKRTIIQDKYVIEIHVQKSFYNELYFNNFGECWVKRGASVSMLHPMEIKYNLFINITKGNRNYIKDKIIKSEKTVQNTNEKLKKIVVFFL